MLLEIQVYALDGCFDKLKHQFFRLGTLFAMYILRSRHVMYAQSVTMAIVRDDAPKAVNSEL